MQLDNTLRKPKRSWRFMRLLKRMRPLLLPLTYRRNQVTLLPNGEKFFKALLAAIDSAECFILLEYYIIRNDATGTEFAKALTDAAARGVSVFLIYDYIGCIETPVSYFKSLDQNGVKVIPFNTPSFKRGIHWFDKRDHRKMAVIDDRIAFLGGFNIGNEYAGRASSSHSFRDVGFSISGGAVDELIRIFGEAWQMECSEPPELPDASCNRSIARHNGRANVVIVSGGPHQRSSYIRSTFLLNIASAAEEILVVSPYFVPGPRIIRSLLRAAKRGVRVRLLLPARSDVPIVLLVGRSSYSTLLRGGIEIYEMEKEILHAKVMLIDRERTVIGSANLDQRSFHRNFEINAMIDSHNFGGQIFSMLNNDFSEAKRIHLESHEQRSIFIRILEKIVNLFGWFL
jgi:cardiolipin synthase A/B